jgi:hypothetical protein
MVRNITLEELLKTVGNRWVGLDSQTTVSGLKAGFMIMRSDASKCEFAHKDAGGLVHMEVDFQHPEVLDVMLVSSIPKAALRSLSYTVEGEYTEESPQGYDTYNVVGL